MDNFTKQPTEKYFVAADFSRALDEGETIVLNNSTVIAYDADGNDVSATVLESGTKQIDGAKLLIRVKDGTSGEKYKITFKAVTSQSNIYEHDITMKVVEQ